MESRTYYDILGVSRDASLEEITAAKNALAKVYHPDANIHKDIDTTAFMQEILEAYGTLSDPQKRKEYNRDTFGETMRVFRTFKVGPEDGEKEDPVSFVTYWNTANRLNDILKQSLRLMEREAHKKKLPHRIFKKIGINKKQEDGNYAVEIDDTNTSGTIRVGTNSSYAIVNIAGENSNPRTIPLSEKETQVEITVTLEDGTTQESKILTITRKHTNARICATRKYIKQ